MSFLFDITFCRTQRWVSVCIELSMYPCVQEQELLDLLSVLDLYDTNG